MGRVADVVAAAKEQDIAQVSLLLHGKLVEILTEAGLKRGKTVRQIISDAILEKADKLYNEDHPEGRKGG